ncbi:MAG: hypothetical protein GY928_40420 [Colwellia sp.]|nr:hypothetical protein [Colwellia sp.]
MENESYLDQPITQTEYTLCLTQCNELKESSDRIVEVVQSVLEASAALTEGQLGQLNAAYETGNELIDMVDNLLELEPAQWNYELVGVLHNELYMRASNITLYSQGVFENLFGSVPDMHQANLKKMIAIGQHMMMTIQRLGKLEN